MQNQLTTSTKASRRGRRRPPWPPSWPPPPAAQPRSQPMPPPPSGCWKSFLLRIRNSCILKSPSLKVAESIFTSSRRGSRGRRSLQGLPAAPVRLVQLQADLGGVPGPEGQPEIGQRKKTFNKAFSERKTFRQSAHRNKKNE